MTDNDFKIRIHGVGREGRNITWIRAGPPRPVFNESPLRREAIQRNAAEAHSALNDWRITMKHLNFDREASAREQQT